MTAEGSLHFRPPTPDRPPDSRPSFLRAAPSLPRALPGPGGYWEELRRVGAAVGWLEWEGVMTAAPFPRRRRSPRRVPAARAKQSAVVRGAVSVWGKASPAARLSVSAWALVVVCFGAELHVACMTALLCGGEDAF